MTQLRESKHLGSGAPSGSARRWLPLGVLLAAIALVFAMGWHRYLTWQMIGLNYDALRAYIGGHLATAILIYAAIYIGVVALSLPGAAVLTAAGGLLFGWQIGVPVTIVAATAGAIVIFLVARTSLGEPLAERAGPSLAKLREGFGANAMSYLLFLRLVPAVPFFAVNIAAALLGVSLRTYALATLIGIVPGTFAISFAGSGLGSVIEAQNAVYADCVRRAAGNAQACVYAIDSSKLVTRELLIAFALLGAFALLPVLLRKLKRMPAPKDASPG